MAKVKNEYMTTQQASDYFDSLDVMPMDQMIGNHWRGAGVDTDHPMDGMLESSKWWGKIFEGPEAVYPLVHLGLNGKKFFVNPAFLPVKLTTRFPLRDTIIPLLFPLLSPLISTRQPKARVRMIEFRGKVSVAMCYDSKAINDCFRKIDEDTVFGWMDIKGWSQPYFFKLYRDQKI